MFGSVQDSPAVGVELNDKTFPTFQLLKLLVWKLKTLVNQIFSVVSNVFYAT